MLKNPKRFVETFKNYASYIHTFSLTDNFRNSRKKGKKEKNLVLEAVFRRCSIKETQVCNFIENETLAQVFFCDFSEILENIFF